MLTQTGILLVLLYIGGLIIAGLAAWVIGRCISRSSTDETAELDPFEIAFLSGGRAAAVQTAVMSLWHRRLLSKEKHSRRLIRINKPIPDDLADLERNILDEMPESLDARAFHRLRLPAAETIREKLERMGLLFSPDQRN